MQIDFQTLAANLNQNLQNLLQGNPQKEICREIIAKETANCILQNFSFYELKEKFPRKIYLIAKTDSDFYKIDFNSHEISRNEKNQLAKIVNLLLSPYGYLIKYFPNDVHKSSLFKTIFFEIQHILTNSMSAPNYIKDVEFYQSHKMIDRHDTVMVKVSPKTQVVINASKIDYLDAATPIKIDRTQWLPDPEFGSCDFIKDESEFENYVQANIDKIKKTNLLQMLDPMLTNVPSKIDKIKILAYLIQSFVSSKSPILLLHGKAGSGKTTLAEVLWNLLNGNRELQLLESVNTSSKDLDVRVMDKRVVAFDNLDANSMRSNFKDLSIESWIAQMSTGIKTSRRKLYSDANTINYEINKPILITSILPNVLRQLDTNDRIIFVEVQAKHNGIVNNIKKIYSENYFILIFHLFRCVHLFLKTKEKCKEILTKEIEQNNLKVTRFENYNLVLEFVRQLFFSNISTKELFEKIYEEKVDNAFKQIVSTNFTSNEIAQRIIDFLMEVGSVRGNTFKTFNNQNLINTSYEMERLFAIEFVTDSKIADLLTKKISQDESVIGMWFRPFKHSQRITIVIRNQELARIIARNENRSLVGITEQINKIITQGMLSEFGIEISKIRPNGKTEYRQRFIQFEFDFEKIAKKITK